MFLLYLFYPLICFATYLISAQQKHFRLAAIFCSLWPKQAKVSNCPVRLYDLQTNVNESVVINEILKHQT